VEAGGVLSEKRLNREWVSQPDTKLAKRIEARHGVQKLFQTMTAQAAQA